MKNFSGRALAPVTACSLLVSQRWSSLPSFRPQAPSRAMRHHVSRLDHDGLLVVALGGQSILHTPKDPVSSHRFQ